MFNSAAGRTAAPFARVTTTAAFCDGSSCLLQFRSTTTASARAATCTRARCVPYQAGATSAAKRAVIEAILRPKASAAASRVLRTCGAGRAARRGASS
eukprot:664808-Prymnesium_polylepis.1